jgi:hypothetical protein
MDQVRIRNHKPTLMRPAVEYTLATAPADGRGCCGTERLDEGSSSVITLWGGRLCCP